jgi:hypothetical protein
MQWRRHPLAFRSRVYPTLPLLLMIPSHELWPLLCLHELMLLKHTKLQLLQTTVCSHQATRQRGDDKFSSPHRARRPYGEGTNPMGGNATLSFRQRIQHSFCHANSTKFRTYGGTSGTPTPPTHTALTRSARNTGTRQ